jgi:hypothetical protein
VKLKASADELEARITSVAWMEAERFGSLKNGHERRQHFLQPAAALGNQNTITFGP